MPKNIFRNLKYFVQVHNISQRYDHGRVRFIKNSTERTDVNLLQGKVAVVFKVMLTFYEIQGC